MAVLLRNIRGQVDNWDSIEFRTFVWDNADGRGEELFELTGTRDLVSQFDPAQ